MKKILPASAVLILLVMPLFAAHAVTFPQPTQTPGTIFTSPQDIINLITTVTNWLFAAVLVLAAAFLIYGGLKFILAGGNTTEVAAARSILINALIGVVVAVAALGLVNVVRTFLE